MSLLETINAIGVLASRPAASAANEGYNYHASDEGITYRSNGSSWDDVAINEAAHADIDHSGLLGVGAGGSTARGAVVTRAATQALTTNVETAISFDTSVTEDDADFWDAGAPTNLVAQRTGWAIFGVRVDWAANSSSYRRVRVKVNGNQVAAVSQAGAAGNTDPFQSVTFGDKLTAGDVVTFTAQHNVGSNLNITARAFIIEH